MELKKWIAGSVVVLEIAAVSLLFADGPATVPSTLPMTTQAATRAMAEVPATRPLVVLPSTRPEAVAGDFSAIARRDRMNRRGRGSNRDVMPVVATTGPDAYAVLKTRSIFVKGNQSIAEEVRPSTYTRGGLSDKQANLLVFNGVILVNDEPDALVEDLTTHEVVKVRPGDAIAGGRVSAITFDDLAYELGGTIKHVAIGENLEGAIASVNPFAPGGSTTLPTTGPVTGGSTGTPSIGSTNNLSQDDIIARLKARRNSGQ
jgi:hypothetical protein